MTVAVLDAAVLICKLLILAANALAETHIRYPLLVHCLVVSDTLREAVLSLRLAPLVEGRYLVLHARRLRPLDGTCELRDHPLPLRLIQVVVVVV